MCIAMNYETNLPNSIVEFAPSHLNLAPKRKNYQMRTQTYRNLKNLLAILEN